MDLFRAGSRPLGQIMEEVYIQRATSWHPPATFESPVKPPRPAVALKPASEVQAGAKKPFARIGKMDDGRKLCDAFNSPKGCNEPCPRSEMHACNVKSD